MSAVELRSLRKIHRGGVVAVAGVDVTIADGEFVCLVGPSGCGKSTTLNLIAGLDAPTSGSVHIGGADVTALSPRERDVAMVFQGYALYPHLDVRRNLAFPLEAFGLAKAEIESRVRETAELLGLAPLLERKPKELSGGQRQRVALGRALVRRPKAFLFDEPLSNLDAALRTQVRGEIKKLHEKLRATFVYVTHDQAEAMTLADRVVVLRDGSVEQIGTPREVYDAPATRFVASFFGSPPINVIDGGKAGIRPEHVEVGLGAAPSGARAGTVFLVEPMGADTFVTVDANGERITARAPAGFSAKSGDAAWVRPDAAKLVQFVPR